MKPSKEQSKLDLTEFDYQNLNGESFKKYIAVAGHFTTDERGQPKYESSLHLNDKYDFEEWKAIGVVKFRINENTGDKEQYLDGIKLVSNQRLSLTRISVKHAIELNRYVSTVQSDYQNSKFYLLAKQQR